MRPQEGPVDPVKALLIRHGSQTLDEVFVGVGRMELHQADPGRVSGHPGSQLSRDVGLPGPWWPVEDDLALVTPS